MAMSISLFALSTMRCCASGREAVKHQARFVVEALLSDIFATLDDALGIAESGFGDVFGQSGHATSPVVGRGWPAGCCRLADHFEPAVATRVGPAHWCGSPLRDTLSSGGCSRKRSGLARAHNRQNSRCCTFTTAACGRSKLPRCVGRLLAHPFGRKPHASRCCSSYWFKLMKLFLCFGVGK